MKTYITVQILAAVIFCTGCETLKSLGMRKPTASLQGVKFQDVALDSATLAFNIEIENPYPVALPLLDMDYDLSSSGNALFKGNAEINSVIPAHDKKVIALPVKINYLDFVKAYKYVRPGIEIPYEANLGLSLDSPVLGKLRLPINKRGQLAMPKMSDISNIDVESLLGEIKK